jgi:hypothetical protein
MSPWAAKERIMNIRLDWWRSNPTKRPQRCAAPDWVNARSDTPVVDDTPAPAGCGWFDSSHELHAGLSVTEHATPARVVNEVPLGWWLDWQAAGSACGGLRQ